MFRMYGNIVELYRYAVKYHTSDEEDETEYCISDQHRDEAIKNLGDTPYTVTPIDQTGNQWIDGLEFDTWDAANAALEAGEAAYSPPVAVDELINILLGVEA